MPTFYSNTNETSYLKYPNESFSGCDMIACINMNINGRVINKVIGSLQTLSYSINMDKKPIRSIGTVNVKDYTIGQRTIAGSLVFIVFNKHFAKDLLASTNSDISEGTSFLVDELPPFDIVISMANEYGYRSKLVIYGIRLLNEGKVMSVNDVYTENTYQYFATDIEYLNDEQSYIRDSERKMYYLKNDIEYYSDSDNILRLKNKMYSSILDENSSDYASYKDLLNREIILSTIVNQSSKSNTAIVDFTISRAKGSGIIVVEKNNSLNQEIQVEGNLASRRFPPGRYTATYYANNKTGASVSNSKVFIVQDPALKTSSSNRSIQIEDVGSNFIKLFSNKRDHKKIQIRNEEDDFFEEFLLNKNGNAIYNLNENTTYSIRTCGKNEEDISDDYSIKTLSNTDSLINKVKNYIELSIDEDKTIYNEILSDIESNDTEIFFDIYNKKESFNNLLNDLQEENKKKELIRKIKHCNDLLYISSNFYNEKILSIEDNGIEDIYLDDNCNLILKLKEDVTHLMLNKTSNNKTNFSPLLKEVKSNKYNLKGEKGYIYKIQAIKNTEKDTPLYVYMPTDEQLNSFINKEKIDISYYEEKVKNDTLHLNESERTRLLIAKIIKPEQPLIESINIEEINENGIKIKTPIYYLQNNLENEKRYLLCLCSLDRIENNKITNKIIFNNKEEIINIDRIGNGLKFNTEYALWIENLNGEKISEVTTLLYNKEKNTDLRIYENAENIEKIYTIAKKHLPNNLISNLESLLEYNENITSLNYIKEILNIICTSNIQKNNIDEFIKSFKYFIGIMTHTTKCIYDLSIFDDKIKFISTIEGTMIICNYKTGESKNYNINIGENILTENTLYENCFLIAISKEMNKKSQLYIINNALEEF